MYSNWLGYLQSYRKCIVRELKNYKSYKQNQASKGGKNLVANNNLIGNLYRNMDC